ncbi:hypothetical protein DRO69_12640 [Candidatus Bathyarchaeota archaeon]|nr:MAG: hypothetical protein DRO69_12640 [Candidatus Bathyarchaeota archaeon]
MPKPGYGAITIPLTLKEQLTAMAKASNQSVPKLLEQLITDLRSSGVGLRGFKSRPPHQICTIFA